MQSQQAQNAALGQQFGQGLQAGQFTNQALQNLFGQGQAAGSSPIRQPRASSIRGCRLGSSAIRRIKLCLDRSCGSAVRATRRGSRRSTRISLRIQQNCSQQLQAAQYQDQARQQAIAEEAQRRGMSLNELKRAPDTAQQVGMPQMPTFTGRGRAGDASSLGEAQAQGQANQADSGGSGIGTLLGRCEAEIVLRAAGHGRR